MNTFILYLITRNGSSHKASFKFSTQSPNMLHTIDLQYAEVFEALASLDSSKVMRIDKNIKVLCNITVWSHNFSIHSVYVFFGIFHKNSEHIALQNWRQNYCI